MKTESIDLVAPIGPMPKWVKGIISVSFSLIGTVGAVQVVKDSPSGWLLFLLGVYFVHLFTVSNFPKFQNPSFASNLFWAVVALGCSCVSIFALFFVAIR